MGSGENPWADWSVGAQLDLMDETGIAVAINSIASPGAYFGDVRFAVQVSRECNEGLAEIAQNHPRRFGGFALLPLPAIKEAVAEAVYALDTLKLDGICLLTHAGQRHLGHPDEDDLYAELDRRHAVVFIHPLRNQAQNVPAYGYPAGMTELVRGHHAGGGEPALVRHVRPLSEHPLDHAARRRHRPVPRLSAERDG